MYVDVKIVELCSAVSTHQLVLTAFCPSIQYKPPSELNTEMFNFLTFEKFSSQSQLTLGGPQTKTFMDCILFDQLMVNLINTGRENFFLSMDNGKMIMTEFQILKGVCDSIYCWIIFIFRIYG